MNFLDKIFKSRDFSVPKKVNAAIAKQFGIVSNIEWRKHDLLFEATFYHEGCEKIARIDDSGSLKEYRVNISLNDLPVHIGKAVEAGFEIMNCIAVYSPANITIWELIVRDQSLCRYQIIINQSGEVTTKVPL